MDVLGVDIAPQRVEAVNSGVSPIGEPGLDRAVADAVASGRLRAGLEPEAADAYIIAVPTPIGSDHSPDLGALYDAVDSLALRLRVQDLVVVESTSPVGTTESVSAGWLGSGPT